MIGNIEEIINNMTLEEKAVLVCGDSFFGMSGVPSMNIPGMQVLDGGTGINYEQLIGDMFSRWNRESKRKTDLEKDEKVDYELPIDRIGKTLKLDSYEAEIIGNITYTEQRNIIFNYFRPDRLTHKELEARHIVKKYLENIVMSHTSNNEAVIVYMYAEGQPNNHIMSPGCFPTGMMLGATFNPDIIYQTGQALGREARAYGINMLLGTPNINIHRDPLNGRLFEGYSEDPCLVSKLAPELVRGVQDEGVAANIKHFAANNQEKNRQGIDEIISERALNEIYFPGFKACVEKGHTATVMAAYNKINGTACTQNKWLLQDMLRDAWGFDGMVVSDWGAVYNQIASLKAGNDVNMPGPVDYEPIVQAVEAGELSEEELNKNVRRILKVINRYTGLPPVDMSCQYIMDMSKQAAYKAACEGIVMMKNQNDIFPIGGSLQSACDSVFGSLVAETTASYGSFNQVVLCGSGAIRLYDCGTGSAGITTDKTSSIYECLVENGVNVSIGIPTDNQHIDRYATYICVAKVAGMEGNDRNNMNLMTEDAQILNRMVDIKRNYPDVKLGLILNVSGPVDLSLWEKSLDGIFCMFLPGMEGGHAMADILTGRVNPSGKLPLTFPWRYMDTPTCLNFPGDGYQVHYGEGIYAGYRYYDKKMIEPMFPFGHGLSYSFFNISNQRTTAQFVPVELVYPNGRIESKALPVFSDSIKISVDVENVGPDRFSEGMEVIQLYISDIHSSLSKPVKELKAFKKVRLGCGEKTTITFELNRNDFASYDGDLHMWTAEEGIYNILIGNSSRNITSSMQVYLDVKSPYSYSHTSSVKALYENVIIHEHMLELWNKMGFDYGDIMAAYQYEPHVTLDILMKRRGMNEEEIQKATYNFDGILEKIKKV